MLASRYIIERGESTDPMQDDQRAAGLYVSAGTGRIMMGDWCEIQRDTPPSISIRAGDLLMVPPGIHYAFVNDGHEPVEVSEQRIPLSVAFHDSDL